MNALDGLGALKGADGSQGHAVVGARHVHLTQEQIAEAQAKGRLQAGAFDLTGRSYERNRKASRARAEAEQLAAAEARALERYRFEGCPYVFRCHHPHGRSPPQPGSTTTLCTRP